jgi:argininosuccinate lyase
VRLALSAGVPVSAPRSPSPHSPSPFPPQEDKYALFDSLDTVQASLKISSGVLATLLPNPDRMRSALNSFMLATDLSEYLVRKGVPFR